VRRRSVGARVGRRAEDRGVFRLLGRYRRAGVVGPLVEGAGRAPHEREGLVAVVPRIHPAVGGVTQPERLVEIRRLVGRLLLDVRQDLDPPGGAVLPLAPRREADRRRREVFVEVLVRQDGDACLVQVVLALRHRRRLADLLDGGDEQRDEDRDDRDHHQQLDQREAAAPRRGGIPTHGCPPCERMNRGPIGTSRHESARVPDGGRNQSAEDLSEMATRDGTPSDFGLQAMTRIFYPSEGNRRVRYRARQGRRGSYNGDGASPATEAIMSDLRLRQHLQAELGELKARGLYKQERRLQGPQGAAICVAGGEVINFCANNYLGLANHPEIVAAAEEGLRRYGYGMASVRFICGTQEAHKQLEADVARFLGKGDAILYSSCWDANGGLFETILTEQDTVLSDELNHASIIDGIRLCKAKRYRYRNGDLADLEQGLREAKECRFRVIATDGVFSMDGTLAPLAGICALADRYDALVMVDDSRATGILGDGGRGTAEALGVLDRVDIITSTLGKTLGGAAGGFTCGSRELVEYLRQRSRPYLFSNAVPPPIIAAA